MATSHRTLAVLAAITWPTGGIMLGTKGTSLAVVLAETGSAWRWIAPALGIGAGLVKMKFLFNHFCQRNLDRIAALDISLAIALLGSSHKFFLRPVQS